MQILSHGQAAFVGFAAAVAVIFILPVASRLIGTMFKNKRG